MKHFNFRVFAAWIVLGNLFGAMHSAIAGGDIELHGFSEYRFGMRIESDPFEDDISLNEIRTQADVMWYGEVFTAQLKGDLIYDDQADDQDDIDLETGHGFIDLRQANIIFSPVSWMDIKLGRQVLTWGTGDLVFINDLFPKDWQSFFLGRDTEYLKAPSDALFFSFFPGVFNVDIAYTPRFDADRHITGERISYWNGMELAGQNDILITDRPNEWFKEDEIATRFYRNLGAFEVAGYTYFGYWKSPGGVDPSTGHMLFPELSVYGMSIRGPVAGGIAHLEAGYYDSREDPDGNDPFINNSEIRALIGYEWEPVKDVTIGVQYYLERMIDYDAYTAALRAMNMPLDSSRDEDRHTVTARLTWMTLNQNLIFNCFTRYSPSDEDVYVKPEITYKVTDRWQATIGGDVFSGSTDYTFLGQFQNNSNIHAGVRYSF